MRARSTLNGWIRDLRRLIESESDPVVTRIAYSMETALRVALSKSGDFACYNPVRDAYENADYLRKDLAR